jgi:TusA-related sulfurtransferase
VSGPTTLDMLGRRCPVPVIELATLVRTMPPGSEIVVLTDDPAAVVDIPVWCRMTGHEYVGGERHDAKTRHRVRVAGGGPTLEPP